MPLNTYVASFHYARRAVCTAVGDGYGIWEMLTQAADVQGECRHDHGAENQFAAFVVDGDAAVDRGGDSGKLLRGEGGWNPPVYKLDPDGSTIIVTVERQQVGS